MEEAQAGNGQIKLLWTAHNSGGGVQNYELFRCSGSGCTISPPTGEIVSGGCAPGYVGTGTSCTDGGLTNGTVYGYIIEACNTVGCSAPQPAGSSPIYATPAVGPEGTPCATAGLPTCVAALSFGNQVVNGSSGSLSITFYSCKAGGCSSGLTGLTVGICSITNCPGTNPGDFSSINNTCGSTLAVGASCTVSVIFTPSASGARAATLQFTDNAADSPQTVSLTGIGVLARPTLVMGKVMKR